MPVTAVHGKKASVNLNSVDISQWLNEFDFPETIETAESTTFQPTGDAKSFVLGLKSWTATGAGLWDATIDGTLATIDSGGVAVPLIWGPTGTTAGMIKYSASVLLTKYDPKVALNAAVTFSIELQITGPVTKSTF